MKNILLTGGLGFIGTNFVRYIFSEDSNIKLHNLDIVTYAGNANNLNYFNSSNRYNLTIDTICNPITIRSILRKYEIDTIIHMAAESHVDNSIGNPNKFITTNINGTVNLLNESLSYWRENGCPDDFKFLHVSTDEVYGSISEGYAKESIPYNPSSPYSSSKAASDHLVKSYYTTYGLPVIITNCSNNYGPYQSPEKLIPKTINNILNNKEIPIYGNGDNKRDWLFVGDHCKALLEIIKKGKVGESYNIGGVNERSTLEIVETICHIINNLNIDTIPKCENLISLVTDRPGHDFRYAVNTEKIHKEIGWFPQVLFEEGIELTVNWYLDNISWLHAMNKKI